jgi:1-acyl-sn-glycerol-3-phosphate acyltransferase
MKDKKFIDVRGLMKSKNPKLLKFLPNFIITYIEKILHEKEINHFIETHSNSKNQTFCKDACIHLNMKIKIKNIENIPKKGGCTIVMNHPLGGMDALAFVYALETYRTDIKFIVNDILLSIDALKELFVGVNKHGKNVYGTHQKIDELFASENLVCVFPAGLVSRKIKGKIVDLKWKKTFVSLSVRNNNPIVPVFIDGKLSNFFYNLSNFRKFIGIKVNFEMLFLANELFKQRNTTTTFKVGEIISPNEITNDKNHAQWAEIIRNKVYELE